VGCEKTLDKGKVSFATNTGIVNCPIDAYLFIDNIKYGVIPDIGDSSRDCNSSSNLNLELPIGKHKFKVEMKGISGSCASDTTGFINIIKDECTLVFIDITKLTK
jgi:hypothetical protein